MIGFLAPIIVVPFVSLAGILVAILAIMFIANSGGPDAGAVGRVTAAEIRAKYIIDSRVSFRHIDVTYHDRDVILDGTASSDEEKQVAEELAYRVTTVRRVINNLRVTKDRPDFPILQNIASQLLSGGSELGNVATPEQAPAEATQSDQVILAKILQAREDKGNGEFNDVQIAVNNGVVLLTGSVESKLLSLRARLGLKKIPGVVEVVDKIDVVDNK